MKRLKDHADDVAPVTRQLLRRHLGQIASLHHHRAGSGTIQSGEQVQQCRFARARLTKQRDKFAAFDAEGNAIDCPNDAAAHG